MGLPLQPSLFSTKGMRKRDPGEMGPDEWMGRSDVAYHGTFHPDWDSNDMLHLGTKAAAQDRLHQVSRGVTSVGAARDYLHPDWADTEEWGDYDLPEVPHELHGRMYARRVDRVASGGPVNDQALNRGQSEWMDEGGESVPSSVRQSGRGGDRAAAERVKGHLERGLTVPYENDTEDRGSTSYLAPRMNTSSWESDVLDAPHASPMSKQFARDRVNKGAELPVPAKSFSEIAATQPVLYNGSNIFNVYDKQHIMRQIDKPQYTVHPS